MFEIKYLKRALMTMFLMLVVLAWMTGQVVDTTGLADNPGFTDPASLTKLIEPYQVLYSALIIIWGYLGKFLGLKAKVSNYVWVVVAGGIVVAGAFIAYGFDVFPLVLSFLSAIGVYDIFFRTAEKAIAKVKNKTN